MLSTLIEAFDSYFILCVSEMIVNKTIIITFFVPIINHYLMFYNIL